jgi:hypothetical protein
MCDAVIKGWVQTAYDYNIGVKTVLPTLTPALSEARVVTEGTVCGLLTLPISVLEMNK